MRSRGLLYRSVRYSFGVINQAGKWILPTYFFLNIFNSTAPIINAYILKWILNILTSEPEISEIVMPLILFALLLISEQIFKTGERVVYRLLFEKAGHQFDLNIQHKLKQMPMSFIDTSRGKNITDDAKNTRTTVVYLPIQMIRIVSNIYSFTASFSMLFLFDWIFSLLFLVLTIPVIIVNIMYEKKFDDLQLKTAPDVRRFSYYRWMLTDRSPAQDVRVYDLTAPLKARYDEEKEKYRNENKKFNLKKVSANFFTEIIKRSGEILFTIVLCTRAINGIVTVGDLALYVSYVTISSTSFQNAATTLVSLKKLVVKKMERFFDFLNTNCPEHGKGSRPLSDFNSLSFHNVRFKYPGTEKYVLDGVSFTLNKGDKLSIVGINGAGKTTIIKLMIGLYPVDSGEILINGYPMSEYSMSDIRNMFSVVFQSYVQYPLTLRENIALSDLSRYNDDNAIRSALEASGATKYLTNSLDNLDTYMTRSFDDKGIELSKGQWQKIAISRAYFKNASIIVFDEPSSALDAESEDMVFSDFSNMSSEKSGILISHRISGAKLSNKIIVLDSGKIIESGTHDELIHLNGLYCQLYQLQMTKYAGKENA